MSESSTLVDLRDAENPAATWTRRVWILLLAALVAVAATGFLGVRTGTVTNSAGGYDLTLRYPEVARAGLDTRWQVRVRHPGGFGKTVELVVTADYFDVFETQGLWPEPSAETRGARYLHWTFDPPAGDTLVVDYDAYIQPASQVGRDGTVAVVVDGRPVVSVHFDTRLMP
jgi:hypothetical protein